MTLNVFLQTLHPAHAVALLSRQAWAGVGVLTAATLLALVGLGTLFARSAHASSYEEPDYQVCERHGDLEVRDYTPRLLAEVTMRGGQNESSNAGFRTLAGYIFSRDTPSGEPIGMTVPVGQVEDQGEWVMWFFLPSRFTAETVPPPADPRIRIVERPAERFAVHHRRGRMRAGDLAEEASLLEAAARDAGLEPIGPATLAVYNGPFTPGLLRRNEILLPVRSSADGARECGATDG